MRRILRQHRLDLPLFLQEFRCLANLLGRAAIQQRSTLLHPGIRKSGTGHDLRMFVDVILARDPDLKVKENANDTQTVTIDPDSARLDVMGPPFGKRFVSELRKKLIDLKKQK